MTQKLILPLMLVLAAITGCASKSSHSATGSDTLSGLELPVPDIPDSITQPERRAAYAARRWWDALDFANDSRSLDTAFIEQNFVNFMTVLANTDTLSQQRAVDRLLSSAQHSPQAWSLMTEVAEKYLYDPNSPFRSDELYIPFLRELRGDDSEAPQGGPHRPLHRAGCRRGVGARPLGGDGRRHAGRLDGGICADAGARGGALRPQGFADDLRARHRQARARQGRGARTTD